MKTIYEKVQYQIAELCCKCYDIGKNDGTLEQLNELIKQELNYNKEKNNAITK